MPFLMTEVALNLEDVFLVFPVFLDDVGICNCYKEVVIKTSLAILAPKSFLVLLLLGSLALVIKNC